MSDNIPIDILDAANSAYMMQLEMGEEAVTAGEHKNMMVIEIAKAIYAERLRCAEIADKFFRKDFGEDEQYGDDDWLVRNAVNNCSKLISGRIMKKHDGR